jgi:hypothetical protein
MIPTDWEYTAVIVGSYITPFLLKYTFMVNPYTSLACGISRCGLPKRKMKHMR